MSKLETKEIQLQVQLDEETAQGTYINMAMVNHNETEFVFDFLYVQPQQPKAKVRARIVTSPKHAKRFIAALQDQMARYEARFGTIDATLPVPDPMQMQ